MRELSIVICLTLTFVFAQTFRPGVQVNDDQGVCRPFACVRYKQGSIYAMWQDLRGGQYNNDIYFSKSTDDGYTWTPDVRVNDNSRWEKLAPSFMVDESGIIYAAWEDRRDSLEGSHIYFTKSLDGGNTWMRPNIRVDDVPTCCFCYDPSLALSSSGIIYVAWRDDREMFWKDFISWSTDSGLTWAPAVRINDDSEGYRWSPSITVDISGYVYAVWEQDLSDSDGVYFAKSIDGGNSWTRPNIKIDNGVNAGVPAVAVDNDANIYVVWNDERTGESHIYFAKSTDGGLTWSENIRVDDGTPGGKAVPSIAVDSVSNLYVVWADTRDGDCDIYFAMSTDGGNNWTVPNIRVNDDTVFSQHWPDIDVDNEGGIYVAWLDGRYGPYDVYFSKGTITAIEEKGNLDFGPSFKCYPNPFKKSISISFLAPQLKSIQLQIYDATGRVIKNLVDGQMVTGFYNKYWDGTDNSGNILPEGIYFCKLRYGKQTQVRKIALIGH
ncbi:hypothetical protein BXT86_00280 [candidate division WOR-3 bacterium 4484_100]|uniref:WW domain-containing protein n=1 Tax=candidate division WOR-3 bacterium 4484_100 TaxID=1936077 RepID=A0A1V4QH81_UNCW3|nr:MAG: hypothetical protein BXT86_00280 [candidate division WOR-3 bacterium 4484_100]